MRRLIIFVMALFLVLNLISQVTGKETVIENFEEYTEGGSYLTSSGMTPNNYDCYPQIKTEGDNKYIESSNCYDGQALSMPFDSSFFKDTMSIMISSGITDGSGNNASSELYISSDKNFFGFGITNWPSGGYNNQLRIRVGKELFAGPKLSAGIWYDIKLDIDWTYSSSNGFGLACLSYKEKSSSEWILVSDLCDIELKVIDLDITKLQIRIDGYGTKFGMMDDIVFYNETNCDCPETPCEQKFTQANLDVQYEAGKQFCIDNPSECGIDVSSQFTQNDIDKAFKNGKNEGYVAGQQDCDYSDDPFIPSDLGDCAIIESNLSITLPCAGFGDSQFSFNLLQYQNPDNPFGYYWMLDVGSVVPK